MHTCPLWKLIPLLKTLLLPCKRFSKNTWTQFLQAMVSLWKIARHRSQIGAQMKGNPEPSNVHKGNNGTITMTITPENETIPFDSRIACSLAPYLAYLNPNVSLASVDGPGALSEEQTHSLLLERSIAGSDIMADRESTRTRDESLNLAHDRILPLVPEFFQRYTMAVYVEAKDTELTIKALTLDYRSHEDPPGWKPILHPEGVLYFYNESKKVVTEANLYERKFYDQIMEDIATLEEFVSTHNIRLPEPYTIAMDLNDQGEGTIYTDYYYADHTRKTLFFLDDLDAPTNLTVWREVKGITSLDHIRHENNSFEPGFLLDATTSHSSTSPYNLADLNSLLRNVDCLEKNIGPQFLGASSFLCRTMLIFSRQKFYHRHGLPSARIHHDHSVHGKRVKKRTFLIKILSPLLFSAPDSYLNNLERIWVDGILHGASWFEASDNLKAEWQGLILYATVLLNANVAFLAIQSIDATVKPYRSPAQISSYISTVSSISGIIIGLLLVRQNGRKSLEVASGIAGFLRRAPHSRRSLETLAILFALPYALLLWGMISFLAAFAWNCFDDSTIATRTIMGSTWVLFTALVLWCVWMGWAQREPEARVEAENIAENSATKEEQDHQDSTSTSERTDSLGRGTGGRVVASWPRRFLAKVFRAFHGPGGTAVDAVNV